MYLSTKYIKMYLSTKYIKMYLSTLFERTLRLLSYDPTTGCIQTRPALKYTEPYEGFQMSRQAVWWLD